MQAGSQIARNTACWPFSDLLFRELTRIELIDPWRLNGRPVGVVGVSLLAGAMALHFGDLALVCSSPLRYSRSGLGTRLAAIGDCAMLCLGYRIYIVDGSDVDLILHSGTNRLTMTAKDLRAHDLLGAEPPLVLHQGVQECDYLPAICLRLMGTDGFRLSYRHDLDGVIELAPIGVQHKMGTVIVSSPADEFGWMHPASNHPFVLDGRYWRTAQSRDWPWPLAREWRSHPASGEYRRVMKAALLARFQQHPALGRRLLALQCAVSVAGVPTGLIEEIAAALRSGLLTGLAR